MDSGVRQSAQLIPSFLDGVPFIDAGNHLLPAGFDTHVTLLGIGLSALALVALQRVQAEPADGREEEV